MLLNVLSSLLLITVIGLGFAALARMVARRWNLVGLLCCSVVCVFIATSVTVWRVRHQQALLGFSPAQSEQQPLWLWFLPVWALGFAGVALHIWRTRANTQPLSLRLSACSLLAYFGAFLLYLLIFAIIDFSSWFR